MVVSIIIQADEIKQVFLLLLRESRSSNTLYLNQSIDTT